MTMRVLTVTPNMDFRFGGPPHVVNGSAVTLARGGCEVEVATMGDVGDGDGIPGAWPEMAELQIPLHVFPRGFLRLIGRSRSLSEIAKANLDRFDVVHVHCVWWPMRRQSFVKQANRPWFQPTACSYPAGSASRELRSGALLLTDVCHTKEVADNGAGVVVPVTVDGLEEGLHQLLSLDYAELADVGRRACEVFAARRAWECVASRLIAVYEAAVADRA